MDTPATTQISKLRSADLKSLQDAYQQAFGKSSKSRNRGWLFKVIAKKIQNNEEPESAKRPVPLAQLVAKFSKSRTKKTKPEKTSRSKVKPVGGRDPRLPKVGTALEREYKGKKLHVTVEADGFTFGGKSYKSLSALAQHITGSKAVNGYLFWQLGDYAKPVRQGAKEKAGQ